MKLTEKAKHAIDFAIFCTGWHYVPNDDFEEGYAWQNAEIGNVPFDGVPLRKYSSDSLYEVFVQQNKEPQPTEQTDLPAPNTVMWWLCRIADPEIRRKVVLNYLKYHITILSQAFDINVAVQCGFGWINTSEGNAYWYALSKSEIPLLSEPDFTEYNELRK